MARAADKLWTLEEFLAFDDGTETSYQLFEGRIVAMNPPLRGHGTLVARLTAMVSTQLRPPCEVVAEAGIIPVNRRNSWYKADLIVTCTAATIRISSSPSRGRRRGATRRRPAPRDFNRKLPDYQQMPSMRDVLLVSSMERLIRHWWRDPRGWTEHRHRRSATVRLTGLPVTLRHARPVRRRPARVRRRRWREGGAMTTSEADLNRRIARRWRRARPQGPDLATKTEREGAADRPYRRPARAIDGRLRPGAALPRARLQGRRRAVRQGRRETGERMVLARFPELVEVKVMGEGFTWETQDRARDIAAAARRLGRGEGDDGRPAYHLVLLDELNIVLRYDYLPLDEVVGPPAPNAPTCTRGHRPQRQAGADRDRRPRHRDDPGQAPVPRRRQGAGGIEF